MAATTTAGAAVTGGTLGTTIGSTAGGTTTAGTVAAGTTALGAADGTGPLLLHVIPTTSTISGTGLGLAPKTAAAAKTAALGIGANGVLGLAAVGAAAAALGYVEYSLLGGKSDLFKDLGESVDRCFTKIEEATESTVKTLVEAFKEGYSEAS